MLTHQKYKVEDKDGFSAGNYPQVVTDLSLIKEGTLTIPDTFKADILIAFTKDHSLKLDWLKANPEFAQLVTSGALPIKSIESLFTACYQNSLFRNGLEQYVRKIFH